MFLSIQKVRLPLKFIEEFKERIYTIDAVGERLPTRGFWYWR